MARTSNGQTPGDGGGSLPPGVDVPPITNVATLRSLIVEAIAGGALHISMVGDSLSTSGANASHVPDLLGLLATCPGPVSGVPCCDVLSSNYGPLGMTQQWNTNALTPSLLNPGAASTDEGNSGNHIGVLFKFAFSGNKATTERIRLYTLPPPNGSWSAAGNYLFNGALVTGRLLLLRTPNGLTGATSPNLVGKRDGVTVQSVPVDAASPTTGGVDEYMDKVDVSLGYGAGTITFDLQAGSGDETGKVIQTLGMYMLASVAAPVGFYFTTKSIGGWTTKSHGSTDASVGYTSGYSDAALASWTGLTKIPGAKRLVWVCTGQNDSGLTQEQRRAQLELIVDRETAAATAAGETLAGIVIQSAADPGPTVSARFDTYDDDAVWAAENLATESVPVWAIKMRPLFPITGTLSGDVPGSLADGVHRTQAGAVEVGRRIWNGILGGNTSMGRITRIRERVIGRAPADWR